MMYEVLWTSLMAHMDRISKGDMYGVHEYDYYQARSPDLVLPPRETPRRYMWPMHCTPTQYSVDGLIPDKKVLRAYSSSNLK